MPRTARLEELGLPFHVIVQGIERRRIFDDDADRADLHARCRRVFAETGIDVLAWAWMPNHAHLVLRPLRHGLGRAMQRVLCGYARAYNLRHGRVGRLFRDRFWSRPVESDEDLLALVAYVLLNPVRGGLVPDIAALERHAWTSLVELMEPADRRAPLVDVAAALAPFGAHADVATTALLGLLAGRLAATDGILPVPRAALSLGECERRDLAVGGTFALRLRTRTVESALRERASVAAVRQRLLARGWTLDGVVARAAAICGARAQPVRTGSRARVHVEARALAAHFACAYLRSSAAEVARATGIARQSVVDARERGRASAEARGLSWEAFYSGGPPRVRACVSDAVPSAT